ncbi:hypothetical protein AKO1_007054, partial [Acrasis kona]
MQNTNTFHHTSKSFSSRRMNGSANQNHHVPSEGFILAKWLESIGVKLKSSFSLDSPTIPEFADGSLLCNIVSILEHKDIQGVTQNPKKSASCLHNIRKALEMLRNKKNMPVELLWSEQEIHKGNSAVILKLLEQMKKA